MLSVWTIQIPLLLPDICCFLDNQSYQINDVCVFEVLTYCCYTWLVLIEEASVGYVKLSYIISGPLLKEKIHYIFFRDGTQKKKSFLQMPEPNTQVTQFRPETTFILASSYSFHLEKYLLPILKYLKILQKCPSIRILKIFIDFYPLETSAII